VERDELLALVIRSDVSVSDISLSDISGKATPKLDCNVQPRPKTFRVAAKGAWNEAGFRDDTSVSYVSSIVISSRVLWKTDPGSLK
jgi:hypothetical protein